jgi:glutathione S-transferase
MNYGSKSIHPIPVRRIPMRWDTARPRRGSAMSLTGAVLCQRSGAVWRQHKHLSRYFQRLMARPSFARAVKEAEPYRKLFPQ